MKIAVRVLICAGCLLAAWVFAWNIFGEIQRFHRIQVWPAGMGRIVDMQPAGFDQEEDKYSIHVMYQYNLSGAMYTGSVYIWGHSMESAEDLSRSYRVGDELRIVYNPDRPAESLVADDRHTSLNLGVILGGIVALGAAAFVYWLAFPGKNR